MAELEAQMESSQAVSMNRPYLVASRIAPSTLSFSMPTSRSFVGSTAFSELIFGSSCPPLAVVRNRPPDVLQSSRTTSEKRSIESNSYEKYSKSTAINLKAVPLSAMERMIRNYVDIHLPQYPIVSGSWLQHLVARAQEGDVDDDDSASILVYGVSTDSLMGHFEYFVLFIVLAISSMTLTWQADRQARSASASLYQSAIQHLHAMSDNDPIQSLQVSLLLAHYSIMAPQRADNWTCIGNAVRMVLNLGLHKQCLGMLGAEQVRLRSRLFWITYGLERSLCATLRLPLSFPEESITTKLQFDDGAEDQQVGTGQVASEIVHKNSSAHHHYQYRKLETEVHRVLDLLEDVGGFTVADIGPWIDNILERLEKWYRKAQTYLPYRMHEFCAVSYNHLMVRVHRPTPRMRTRSDEDRKICINACKSIIEHYWGQQKQSRLFYPWHGVHVLFEVAVVSLDACWWLRDSPTLRPQVEQMLEVYLPQCSELLNIIGEHWNEAKGCGYILHRLLPRVSAAVHFDPTWRRGSEQQIIIDEASIVEELKGLLYPDGPLNWSTSSEADLQFSGIGNFHTPGRLLDIGMDTFQLDLDLDMNDFQWEPDLSSIPW